MKGINRIGLSDVDRMIPNELRPVVGTRFGNLFMLRGLIIVRNKEGLFIDFAWESLVEQ